MYYRQCIMFGDRRPAFAKALAGKAGFRQSDRTTTRPHGYLRILQRPELFQVFCCFDKQPLN
jgi:hypothetical protein